MSSASFSDAKEQVRQAVDIADLVASYVTLRREGRIYKAICPWHDDSRPSLQVNPERQSFKCWVCDVGGDIFTFVMMMERVEFREALEILAQRAGVSLASASGASKEAASERQQLFEVVAWAREQFHHDLIHSPDAAAAREYLSHRRIHEESIQTFQMGYAPSRWDWLLKRAEQANFSPELLVKAGLAVNKQDSPTRYYDRFRGRVMFTICDVQGRPVAFGGRILPGQAGEDEPKYINSPQTPLFDKSRTLYGMDVAKNAISKARQAIVMEGYTDCVIAHQCGFQNALAVLGTALGEHHIQLLKRFADQVTLVLDGDEAGQKRTDEVLELFVSQQYDLRILTLPENQDPCDFLLNQGPAAFDALLGKTVDALEHRVQVAMQDLDPIQETHRANQALESILGTLAKSLQAGSGDISAQWVRGNQLLARLAHDFRVDEKSLRTRLDNLRRKTKRLSRQTGDKTDIDVIRPSKLDSWDRELLELILRSSDVARRITQQVSPDELVEGTGRTLFDQVCQLCREGVEPTYEQLMHQIEDPTLKALVVDLDERGREKSPDQLDRRVEEVLENYQRRRQSQVSRQRTALLEPGAGDVEDQHKEINELFEELRTRHGLSSPTDG